MKTVCCLNGAQTRSVWKGRFLERKALTCVKENPELQNSNPPTQPKVSQPNKEMTWCLSSASCQGSVTWNDPGLILVASNQMTGPMGAFYSNLVICSLSGTQSHTTFPLRPSGVAGSIIKGKHQWAGPPLKTANNLIRELALGGTHYFTVNATKKVQ